MSICIWSALHFGIPITRQSFTSRIGPSALWIFIALNAPEVLLYGAVHERVEASYLMEIATEYLPSQPVKPGTLARIYRYITRQKTMDDHDVSILYNL